MLDYTGANRMDYEEVLRAIGFFVDQNNLKEICIIELKEGLLVRGLRYTADPGGWHTISESFLFTNEDLEKIVDESFKRRNAGREGQSDVKPQRGGLFGKK